MNIVTDKIFKVTQYRPAFFSGYKNEVIRNVRAKDLENITFVKKFKYPSFIRFEIKPFQWKYVLMAHYNSGEHYVIALLEEEFE